MAVTLLIAYLSTRGGVKLPVEVIQVDKLGHFAAYLCLAVSFLWGFWKIGKLTNRLSWYVVFCASGYGIVLEFIQFAYFPDRFFELLDIVANICGALAGLYIFRFIVIKTF